MKQVILGIESSCDECSASVIEITGPQAHHLVVKSLATYSQVKLHQPFGGVVPEVASRNHLETINHMINQALSDAGVRLEDINAIAVTTRPGLVGALLVGVTAAKSLSYSRNIPLVPIHHLEGHAASIFLEAKSVPEYPAILAIVSGGHTNLYLVKTPPQKWALDFLKTSLIGRSRDDAAGEAFDKSAKLMGFPYPGGMWIDKKSKGGNPSQFSLPRALPQKKTLDFSFSGLKTAAALLIQDETKKGTLEKNISSICASIQEAIVDAIIRKIDLACKQHRAKSLAIVGGVAANSRLRYHLDKSKIPVFFPKAKYCTDNAAMIAAAGSFRYQQKNYLQGNAMLKLNAQARSEF